MGFVLGAFTPAASAVVGVGPSGRLADYDGRTLRVLRAGDALRGGLWGASRGEQGRWALGVSSRGRLQVVDRRLDTVALISTGRREALPYVHWVRGDRVMALTTEGAAVEFDVPAGRVARRLRLGGDVVAAVGTPGALVALVAPARAVGPAWLMVLRAEAPAQRVELPRVSAGFVPPRPDIRSPADFGHTRTPGLAADRDLVYVAPVELDRVVEVALPAGTVREQPVAVARAAKGGSAEQRFVHVLRPGWLVIGGNDFDAQGRRRHYGMHLVQLAAHSTRSLSADPQTVLPAARGLAAAVYARGRVRLTVFARSGLRRFTRRLPGSNVVAAGRLVYVSDHRTHRTRVLDGRTGRLLNRLETARLPRFLGP